LLKINYNKASNQLLREKDTMKNELVVKNINVNFFSQKKEDYISLTDIAKYKNKETTGLVISHRLSTRYTVESSSLSVLIEPNIATAKQNDG